MVKYRAEVKTTQVRESCDHQFALGDEILPEAELAGVVVVTGLAVHAVGDGEGQAGSVFAVEDG